MGNVTFVVGVTCAVCVLVLRLVDEVLANFTLVASSFTVDFFFVVDRFFCVVDDDDVDCGVVFFFLLVVVDNDDCGVLGFSFSFSLS